MYHRHNLSLVCIVAFHSFLFGIANEQAQKLSLAAKMVILWLVDYSELSNEHDY